MDNTQIVPVAQQHLDQLKTFSNTFFKVLTAHIGLVVATRKGYDMISQGLGYSSHPHLCILSKGFSTTSTFSCVIRDNKTVIAENLFYLLRTESVKNLSIPHIDLSDILNIITQCIPDEIKTFDKMFTNLCEMGLKLNMPDTNYPQRARLHLESIEKNSEVILDTLQSMDLTKYKADIEWIQHRFTKDNYSLGIKYLYNSKHLDVKFLYQLLTTAIEYKSEEVAILLVSYGATLDYGIDNSRSNNVYQAIDNGLIKFLTYVIDNNAIRPSDHYLLNINNDNIQLLPVLNRIASHNSRMNAVKSYIQSGQGYCFAYLLTHYPEITIAINFKSMIEADEHFSLEQIFKTLVCYPQNLTYSILDLLEGYLSLYEPPAIEHHDGFILEFLTNNQNPIAPLNDKNLCTLSLTVKSHLMEALYSCLIHAGLMTSVERIQTKSHLSNYSDEQIKGLATGLGVMVDIQNINITTLNLNTGLELLARCKKNNDECPPKHFCSLWHKLNLLVETKRVDVKDLSGICLDDFNRENTVPLDKPLTEMLPRFEFGDH